MDTDGQHRRKHGAGADGGYHRSAENGALQTLTADSTVDRFATYLHSLFVDRKTPDGDASSGKPHLSFPFLPVSIDYLLL